MCGAGEEDENGMTFKPVYKISETILHNLTTIAASAMTVENAPLIPKWELSIRREALLRNAHASTAIEGNPLSLEQVSDLAAGREVMVNRKAKAEVLNYLSVLEDIPVLAKKPFSEKLILDVHKRLTRDVLDRPVDSGAYRTTQVVVGNRFTGEISFRPPRAHDVPTLMHAFVVWLSRPEKQRSPILEAGISHYELVRIHPFIDGNGRTARALASLILGLGLYGALVVWGPWLFRQPTWREALALALYPRNSLLIAMPLVWLGYFGRTAVRQRFRAAA